MIFGMPSAAGGQFAPQKSGLTSRARCRTRGTGRRGQTHHPTPERNLLTADIHSVSEKPWRTALSRNLCNDRGRLACESPNNL
eukprot:10636792-Lingulodinium_polyedra.AAC.1